jgi:hypothetical protein
MEVIDVASMETFPTTLLPLQVEVPTTSATASVLGPPRGGGGGATT